MLMKVHPKGQVVIPAEVRKRLGIAVGDMLEVTVDPDRGTIQLRRPDQGWADSLGGSLHEYARGRSFPTEKEMEEALRRGLTSRD